MIVLRSGHNVTIKAQTAVNVIVMGGAAMDGDAIYGGIMR
jgi:hypothetical protein